MGTARSLEYHKDQNFHADLSEKLLSEISDVKEIINIFLKWGTIYITLAYNKYCSKFYIY